MVIFSALSWGLLKYLSEREASNDATKHLSYIKNAYRSASGALLQDLTQVARNSDVISSVSHPPTVQSQQRLEDLLVHVQSSHASYHVFLPIIDVFTKKQRIVGKLEDRQYTTINNAHTTVTLLDQAMQKRQPVSTLQIVRASSGPPTWLLRVALPIVDQANTPIGVLTAVQAIDDDFALNLVRKTGFNVALCQGTDVLGTTMRENALDQNLPEDDLCTIDKDHLIGGSQYYLARAGTAQAENQIKSSRSLTIVDIEPLYTANTHTGRYIQILLAVGIFVFAFGVIAYTFITRIFFIRPLRRIQARVRSLVAETNNAGTEVQSLTTDELSMLARSFNLLSESLSVQESESQAMTKQMRDLLIMSDAFISTLNLEHLLGEIVSRLGLDYASKKCVLAPVRTGDVRTMGSRSLVGSSSKPKYRRREQHSAIPPAGSGNSTH